MRLLAAFFLLGLTLLHADPAAELKTALATFTGRDLVKAAVAYDYWHRSGDEKKPVEETAKISLRADAGPEGLRITWPRELIEAAAAEQRARAADPEKKTTTRQAMDELGAIALSDYLNAAPSLLRTLEQAQLVEVKTEPWQGRPARRLAFKLSPAMSEQDRSYIKRLDATASVWIGEDGRPLGAERHVYLKGRALLVIGFESDEREEFRFTPVGDRLVVVSHVKESSGSGGGQSGKQKTTAVLTLAGGGTAL
jgi:hypothetical protein